ncbi:MAG TPA: hypothetical protein VGK93_01440 [Candidatus Eisenbacteria bacterium]|jgi:pimeloyl-ACP methyl ester carboxylesterase
MRSLFRFGIATALAPNASHVEGRIGPGALYVIEVPDNWNGELVVWVHGYTPPVLPVTLPDVPLRGFLLSQGFAVAASSFSENGYAVPEAVRQTHQLNGIFASRCGRPSRTYLIGVSLGGIIGLQLIEKFPQQYDGALLACGVVGGTKAEVKYIGDVRVLFDYFYPGCLGGTITDVPDEPFTPNVQNKILQCVGAHQERIPPLVCLAGLPGANGTEFVTSLVTAIGFQWMGGEDLFDRTHHHQLYDNDHVVYRCPLLPDAVNDAVNAGVVRYSSTPSAENFMRHYYEPTGNIQVPLLTHHTTRDPVVPLWHEDLFRAKVEAAGKSHLLLQRTRDAYGHCNFQEPDLPLAFLDLVGWVRTGQKPPVL